MIGIFGLIIRNCLSGKCIFVTWIILLVYNYAYFVIVQIEIFNTISKINVFVDKASIDLNNLSLCISMKNHPDYYTMWFKDNVTVLEGVRDAQLLFELAITVLAVVSTIYFNKAQMCYWEVP